MPNDLLSRFRGHEATVAAVARHMRKRGLAPDDVLAAYDAWMAERLAEMAPGVENGLSGEQREKRRSSRLPLRGDSTLDSPHSTLRKRHKAGDFARMPDACPACGGAVEIYQLCPIESPAWRAQLACMADDCAWHGKSKLSIDALLAAGAANLKNNVTEG